VKQLKNHQEADMRLIILTVLLNISFVFTYLFLNRDVMLNMYVLILHALIFFGTSFVLLKRFGFEGIIRMVLLFFSVLFFIKIILIWAILKLFI
jgi:hypothetical protein